MTLYCLEDARLTVGGAVVDGVIPLEVFELVHAVLGGSVVESEDDSVLVVECDDGLSFDGGTSGVRGYLYRTGCV